MFQIDRPLILGTVITIALSIILFLAGVDPFSSLILGVLGIIISMLIELFFKISKLEENLLKVMNLNQQFLQDNTFFRELSEVISGWSQLKNSIYHRVFRINAELIFSEFKTHLGELVSGVIRAEPYDFQLQNILFDEAHQTIKATSLVDIKWWETAAGKNYLEANFRAAKRGVRITRIFICELNSETISQMKKQSLHVDVRFAPSAEIPTELKSSLIISDDKLAWFSQLTDELQFAKNRISASKGDVNRALQIFNQLLLISGSFKEKTTHVSQQNPQI